MVMPTTRTQLLSQAELDKRRADDDYRLFEVERDLKQTARAVFVLRGDEVMDPEKARQRKLAQLSAFEADSLATLDSIKANAMGAIRQISELGPQDRPTDEQLAQMAAQESAIRNAAEPLSTQGLLRALRDAIFDGDPVKGLLWAQAAQAVLDRAQDAGQQVTSADREEITGLARQLSTLGSTADRRPALRTPHAELAEKARRLEQSILDARKARGDSLLGRGFESRPLGRTVPFPGREPARVNATGYPELNHFEGIEN